MPKSSSIRRSARSVLPEPGLPSTVRVTATEVLKQAVRLRVDDAVALHAGGMAKGLGNVALADPHRPVEQHRLLSLQVPAC